MRFDILSLFPRYFTGPFEESMIGQAVKKGVVDIRLVDMREFASGPHRRADDRAYGGGPGMVLMAEPVAKAIRGARASSASRVIFLSPQGTPLTATKCRQLAQEEQLILLCGHYEGIDQRVLDAEVDEEISIGDYVLTNGCLAAIVLVDAVLRFVPGFLGHEEAARQDSFEEAIFDCPHFTRPERFEGRDLPEVLKSGDHGRIARWRRAQALGKTLAIRPDLYLKYLEAQEVEEESQQERQESALRWGGLSLWVSDLGRTVQFLRKRLGLSACVRGQSASVRLGDQTLLLLEAKEEGWVSMEGIAIDLTVSDEALFQKIAHRVRQGGLKKDVIRDEVSAGVVDLRDPDGYFWRIRMCAHTS